MAKSYKREVAGIALLFWMSVSAFLVWYADPERISALTTIYGSLTGFVWTFAAAAFGLHSIATQWGNRK